MSTLRQHNSMVVLQWHHLEAKMVVGLISYQIQGLVAQLKKKHYQTVEQAKLKNCKIEIGQLDSEYQYLVEPLLRN